MTKLACSECGIPGTYRACLLRGIDVCCFWCGHEVMFSDFDLDAGESLVFNEHGVLVIAVDEHMYDESC